MNGLVPSRVIALSLASALACTPRAPVPVRGIELDDPQVEASRAAQQSAAGAGAGLVEAEPNTRADGPEQEDSEFVFSRDPAAERAAGVPRLPIHIQERWWAFRAQHLGISEEQAQKRDAQMSRERAPANFWDEQTSIEAVSVWSVLCNECHGGRRKLDDAREMPKPSAGWGSNSGLFFGNRRTYRQMFNTVYDGGPIRESGRAEMPAWQNILSTEMIWALLYFLEYQSGGIESRFPPSLYPRRPKMLGTQ